jgi:hypothetical protein
MILAQSLAAARAQRTQRVLPDGRAIWVSRVFPASGATPEMPMASCVPVLPCGCMLPGRSPMMMCEAI